MKTDPLITFRRLPASLNVAVLESFAETLLRRLARGRPFHCLITGDTELRLLNRTYRREDHATDVLSFPADGDYLGDIAISLGRARSQARKYGHTLEDEVRVLMLHGVLHLKGMDHESDSGQMARTESRWRKRLGLPDGLIERVV